MTEESKDLQGWWQTVPGILTATAGIITAVTGLVVALNQIGFFAIETAPTKDQLEKESNPPVKDNIKIITDNWSGDWRCRHKASGSYSNLYINGNGADSTIWVYYPKARGDRPASEVYSIRDISTYKASGDYEYIDANPRKGPTGRIGVWTGDWSIDLRGGTLDNPVIKLFREDHASEWRGTYTCTR